VNGSWDPDIAALKLSDVEKSGLQVYRNYSSAFSQHQIGLFVAEVDAKEFDLSDLQRVLALISKEEIRLVPVIVCAFLDSALNEMYRREIPESVPGGRKALFGAYGPLSSLSSRIQIAYCFGWITPDVLEDIDSVRKIRNKLSHAWNHDAFCDYYKKPPISTMSAVERILGERQDELAFEGLESSDALDRFRVRLLWVTGRAYYETMLYPWAMRRRIDPPAALYGEKHPKLLVRVSSLCAERTRMILKAGPKSEGPLSER
jgi:DNA-binding MltR family transcriptional regulator